MEILTTKKYDTALAHQGWHDKLDEVRAYFQGRARGADCTTESGFSQILSNEQWANDYSELVASLCSSDEKMKNVVKSISRHSIENVRNPLAVPRSTEATDGLANNANYSSLARLNSWVITGYVAKSKCLDLYHTITSDDPTVSYKYNIDYIMKGNDPKRYLRPQADRNGDLGDLYDLPMLGCAVDGAGDPVSPNYEIIAGQVTNGTDAWIKIGTGVRGNVFDDDGAHSASKYTLEKNPRITGIRYAGIAGATPETASGIMRVYLDRKTSFGEQQKKSFYEKINIPYTTTGGASAAVEATLSGSIDLDTGDYEYMVIGPITHLQHDTRTTNVANELGTIRHGSYQVIEDFSVDNHPYGAIPITPEMSDDFNIGGEGVTAVAYATDKVTSAMANMRDVTMERELDRSYAMGPENHKLYGKVGGFAGSLNFPLAARLPGGNDPLSWMTKGLKMSITHHLSRAERFCMFEDNIARQWYILGSEEDIDRIPDISYTEWAGEGGVGGQTEKFGFYQGDRAGWVDSVNRRVRVIGSHYNRHYMDSNGNRVPMRAVLKSLSLELPTSVYLPYSFRIYSGIMSEYSKRTGLIVSARDCVKVLTCVQSRINLIGNDDNLYNAICSTNTPQGLSFPEGSDTITITAG